MKAQHRALSDSSLFSLIDESIHPWLLESDMNIVQRVTDVTQVAWRYTQDLMLKDDEDSNGLLLPAFESLLNTPKLNVLFRDRHSDIVWKIADYILERWDLISDSERAQEVLKCCWRMFQCGKIEFDPRVARLLRLNHDLFEEATEEFLINELKGPSANLSQNYLVRLFSLDSDLFQKFLSYSFEYLILCDCDLNILNVLRDTVKSLRKLTPDFELLFPIESQAFLLAFKMYPVESLADFLVRKGALLLHCNSIPYLLKRILILFPDKLRVLLEHSVKIRSGFHVNILPSDMSINHAL